MKPTKPDAGAAAGQAAAEPISEWMLERLARGELEPAEAERLRARLTASGDPAGASRLAMLEASNQQILSQHPPAEVATEIRRRLAAREVRDRAAAASNDNDRSRRSYFLFGGLATGAAALAALLLVAAPRSGMQSAGESLEITTIKGLQPQLTIYRQQRGDAGAASAERLSPNGSVRAGDTVQMSYVSSGQAFGVVASVDSRGTVTLHLPESAGPAARLAPQGETALPHAFKLDSTPGFERFVFVTSDSPFTTTAVVEALKPGNGQRLSARFEIVESTLYKEMP